MILFHNAFFEEIQLYNIDLSVIKIPLGFRVDYLSLGWPLFGAELELNLSHRCGQSL